MQVQRFVLPMRVVYEHDHWRSYVHEVNSHTLTVASRLVFGAHDREWSCPQAMWRHLVYKAHAGAREAGFTKPLSVLARLPDLSFECVQRAPLYFRWPFLDLKERIVILRPGAKFDAMENPCSLCGQYTASV